METLTNIIQELLPHDQLSLLTIGVVFGIFGGSFAKLILVSIFPQTARIFAMFDRTTKQLINIVQLIKTQHISNNDELLGELAHNKKFKIAHKVLDGLK